MIQNQWLCFCTKKVAVDPNYTRGKFFVGRPSAENLGLVSVTYSFPEPSIKSFMDSGVTNAYQEQRELPRHRSALGLALRPLLDSVSNRIWVKWRNNTYKRWKAAWARFSCLLKSLKCLCWHQLFSYWRLQFLSQEFKHEIILRMHKGKMDVSPQGSLPWFSKMRLSRVLPSSMCFIRIFFFNLCRHPIDFPRFLIPKTKDWALSKRERSTSCSAVRFASLQPALDQQTGNSRISPCRTIYYLLQIQSQSLSSVCSCTTSP